MFGKKLCSAPAEVPVTVDDENPHDLAALEAESEAAYAAGEAWDGRDPAVINAELDAAQAAARLARDLNIGAAGNVTRKEFEEFKVAVAVAFMGLNAAQRDQLVRPHVVPNLVSAHAAAIGVSRAQAKAVDDFQHMIAVVEKYYSTWDRDTASERARARREASYRRPPQ
jgi:hypothetical protein